eukprot:scaffold58207_cov21-Tisochrysis_lutea.AAC.1
MLCARMDGATCLLCLCRKGAVLVQALKATLQGVGRGFSKGMAVCLHLAHGVWALKQQRLDERDWCFSGCHWLLPLLLLLLLLLLGLRGLYTIRSSDQPITRHHLEIVLLGSFS